MIIRRRMGWPAWDWRFPRDLERMRREMDSLFEDLFQGYSREPAAGVFPLTNVTEDKEKYYVCSELPGVETDDLDITIIGDNLAISGERRSPAEKEGTNHHRKERQAGKFSRMITLPGQVDVEKVEAKSADGILTVVLPKVEKTTARKISVRAG